MCIISLFQNSKIYFQYFVWTFFFRYWPTVDWTDSLLFFFFPGFLNANGSPNSRARVANYGLMDQIAVLHWVQQNIAVFGGDPENVSLMGHGPGAACINFLMISPTVVPGNL